MDSPSVYLLKYVMNVFVLYHCYQSTTFLEFLPLILEPPTLHVHFLQNFRVKMIQLESIFFYVH